MPLNIHNFENTAHLAQQLNLADNGLNIGAENKVEIRQHLTPPGKWTSFKASFSNWPFLKDLSTVRQARSQMETYNQQVDSLKVSNRQVMQSFMLCLQDEFGPHIANMATKDIDKTNGTPLTSRTVSRVMENVEQETNILKTKNNFTMMRFLENSTTGGYVSVAKKIWLAFSLKKRSTCTEEVSGRMD